MDLQENQRMEEWGLILGDWIRSTSRFWYYGFVVAILGAFPLYLSLNLVFENLLISSNRVIKIDYQETVKETLQITEEKIFDLGNNTYSGYVKIKNNNSEWGVPNQPYSVEFKTAGGTSVFGFNATTYVLPFSEKVLVFRRFTADTRPTKIDLTLSASQFIRPPELPTLDLEIQRKSTELGLNETKVNAVIVNRTAFKISRVDLPVLLFNSKNQIIGANYTNINDLESSESRSFQYVWYNSINDISRIEIIPELNIYDRSIFVTGPGENPFDNIDFKKR
jgi:hypothetical protein